MIESNQVLVKKIKAIIRGALREKRQCDSNSQTQGSAHNHLAGLLQPHSLIYVLSRQLGVTMAEMSNSNRYPVACKDENI